MRLLLFALAILLLPLRLMAGDAQQTVVASRLVDAAQIVLRERLPGNGDATLSTMGAPEDVRVPTGAVSIKARDVSGRWPRSRVGVPVDVLVDGRVVRSATVWFAVSVRGKALTYSEDAAMGVPAQSLRTQAADIDMAALQETPVESPEALDGLRLRRPVQAGAPVLSSDFEKIPDVDRREKVRVLASYGAIHLTTHGVANSTGNAGDVVPVLVDGADVPVRARVTDKGVVEVVQ
ncbi:flagellar basal body P-ring formation chaperone FlgA [Dyella terrae]|uniref:flagellar basal body P-ring formation chaperone FlgA n=1 Tax=Dyella terrae TaxID=522259 RepID=UPI001EFC4930|nr:flagellar basal body P-ring formation chaperone FlgA [Dyella terrae]ULU23704.1 flagellar basal body P-ring formation chaperone FlgA [Dyella terrae]